MAVQTVTLLAAATSLAPNTYRRPNPNTNPTGQGVPAGATWYKALIDVSQMLDPATHFEFRTEFALDGSATRQVTDGVTSSGSPIVTSASGAFTAADVGKSLNHANIPTGAVIQAINSGTSVTMSQNSTASGSGLTLVIGPTWFEYGGGGRSGGVGHAKDGVTVLTNAGIFVGQDAQNPNEPPLPGSGLPAAQRRARAFLVTTGGTFTLGPITLSVGGPADTQPATT